MEVEHDFLHLAMGFMVSKVATNTKLEVEVKILRKKVADDFAQNDFASRPCDKRGETIRERQGKIMAGKIISQRIW